MPIWIDQLRFHLQQRSRSASRRYYLLHKEAHRLGICLAATPNFCCYCRGNFMNYLAFCKKLLPKRIIESWRELYAQTGIRLVPSKCCTGLLSTLRAICSKIFSSLDVKSSIRQLLGHVFVQAHSEQDAAAFLAHAGIDGVQYMFAS